MKRALLILLLAPIATFAQTIITIAGTGSLGYSGDGAPATSAQFQGPWGIASDNTGNLYVADCNNHRVREIDTMGIIRTIAGNGIGGYSGDGGQATAAQLADAAGIAVDGSGNLYIADEDNNCIRKVNSSGIITTIAGNGAGGYFGDGGPATLAELYHPTSVCIDGLGNVYIGDITNARIRKVDTSGIITTFAGNGIGGYSGDGGTATAAELWNPTSVTIDAYGNLLIGDAGNYRIRKVDTFGMISTFAGNGTTGFGGDGGPATAASLSGWGFVISDALGNVYLGDNSNRRVRKISAGGIINTIAGDGSSGYSGDGGPATSAELQNPLGGTLDSIGNLYFGDLNNNRVRKIISNNYIPLFTAGRSQSLTACSDSGPVSIDSLLSVFDIDTGQNETWQLVSGPYHGTSAIAFTATSTGDTLTPTGQSYTPTAGYTGNDTIKVRIDDGVSIYFTTIYIVISNCSLDIHSTSAIGNTMIFPNPTSSKLLIASREKITQLTITNAIGQTVCSHNYNTENVQVDVADLPIGVYFIKVNGSEVRKFVKK